MVFNVGKLVLSHNRDFEGKGFCHGGLYVLDADRMSMNKARTCFSYIVESLDLSHGRLRHVNFAASKRVKQLSLIPNLTNSEHWKFERHIEEKHFKNPFETVERIFQLLELI